MKARSRCPGYIKTWGLTKTSQKPFALRQNIVLYYSMNNSYCFPDATVIEFLHLTPLSEFTKYPQGMTTKSCAA